MNQPVLTHHNVRQNTDNTDTEKDTHNDVHNEKMWLNMKDYNPQITVYILYTSSIKKYTRYCLSITATCV